MFASKDTLLTRPSGGYNIARSVRLRSSASAYLTRTPASAGNQKTWTWSAWVKRGDLSVNGYLFSCGSSYTDTGYIGIGFASDGGSNPSCFNITTGSQVLKRSSAQLRDPAAWYHLLIAFDTTQATDNNRVRMYINGVEVTSFLNNNTPTLNTDYGMNQASATYINRNAVSNDSFTDSYIAEQNFIDGQALTPNSFGTFNSYGVWQPITYGGSYGTNGFYLPFTNTTSTTTLGYDFSPNGNNWTPNNISTTAGTTYDSMTDVPTLTSATAANWCTWNPLLKGSDVSTASGNLEASWSGANGHCIMATMTLPQTGKWKCEITGVYQVNFGITPIATQKVTEGIGTTVGYGYRGTDGQKVINGSYSAYGATYGTSDVITLLYNADTLVLEFKKNNTSQGTISVASDTYVVGVGYQSPSAGTAKINFGQQPFTYTDSGFVALNTFNLPDSTIKNGAGYMAATIYTGNSPSSQSINNAVNGVSFQPDFVWQKSRSQTYNHTLYDSVRGTTKELYSNLTSAEVTDTNGLTAFTSSGFTIGSDGELNDPTGTHVAWQWKAGGTAVSNTAGSITSQVSVGATQGFSVVTYTGGATGTVGHGLGVTPSMIIVKNRTGTADNWYVWHGTFTATEGIDLNLTDAKATGIQWWNSTLPTSSVFSVKTGGYGTANSGSTYVAYCFAAVAGYSAFGSYVGNGSADGPFVYTGFRPRFVMIKDATNASTQWTMLDSSRNTSNLVDLRLIANLSNSESQQSFVDFTSNGFKVRDTNITPINTSGATVIYMAFAENPFKNSLAR
jgi:hypothetical protein